MPLLCLLLLVLSPAPSAQELREPATFTNPIVRAGADPWIVHREGWYYFTSTAGNRVDIRKARNLADLGGAKPVTIWSAPASGPNSRDVWAPEFHRVGERWFVYYTATTEDRADAHRRIFALESTTDDLQGDFIDRGQLRVPGDDEYAIDGTLLQEPGGELRFLWSGRERSARGPQNIYIAPMSDPWTISGPRVLLSTPEHAWEKHGWAVNEGPQVLQRAGRTFVVFSASGFSTPQYCLGLLTHTGGDLLDPRTWEKSPAPVFAALESSEGAVYGPGHNGFFRSPDGTEDWLVYHARDTQQRAPGRSARAQRFTWTPSGAPSFGRPIPPGVLVAVPSGEPSGD